ncbi:uncharacterized protein B0I36DRAFT_82075 [Microdochium trichocladiopsis]|uniref:Uncharacterized protein n=1 Tax=Microdochium trichocladiopsis TaxID=1682393 RepID=A0A9P8YCT0_9PEZI|nr:uncharacterized protein B0I36DRAFT_82075 [Microdochium trichocladiopsis]KAH7034556.1 hypothetical protein B0I36DRAFT_82075 [Microdochium trichocladiopsis]
MAAEARKSPQTQETLAPPVLTLLLSLKAELLRLHFLPLKQKYDDSLRNIPRTEPNPAAYIGRQADLYNNSRNACKERIARQLHEQIDNVLLQATTELDSWLTEVKTPAKADGPRDIRDAPGQGAAVPTPKKGVETRDGTQANTIKDLPRARYQATIEDVPDAGDEEDSLFVPQSPSPGSSGLSSMSGFTDNLIAEDLKPAKPAVGGDPKGKAPEQKLRQPEASHQPQARGPDTQSPADPKPKPPRQQDRVSVSAKYRDGKITFTPANPSAGAKRPSASVTDYFTPTKQPAAKKAKHASDAAAPKLPPMVPKPYLTTKNTISITEVNEDECVHHFGQHKGLYVLRCNKLACKNRVREQEGAARKVSSPRNLARMTVYFSANPLDSDRALDHFKGRGHGLRQMKDIYEKYAVRGTH